jgi:SnoaL-like polyketide cyclase
MKEIVLEISRSALPSWRLLPHCVRWHVGSFPGISAPEGDVAEAATRLSIAFPRLVRRVSAVTMGEPIMVLLECEGLHEGMWGDIIRPTRRRVTFEEQHEIVAVDGRIVSDRITLDLPGILLQLCGNDGIDPDETARMGKARRELHERARAAGRRSRGETPRS